MSARPLMIATVVRNHLLRNMMSRGRCHKNAGIESLRYSSGVHVPTYQNIAGGVSSVHILNQQLLNKLSQLYLTISITTHRRISVVPNSIISLFSNTAHYTFISFFVFGRLHQCVTSFIGFFMHLHKLLLQNFG